MKRENIYESDTESSCYDEKKDYYSETMNTESQPHPQQQQQQQQEEQHPYMSLYQPLLFATVPAKVEICPSTSQQQQQPDETFSSSAVTEQLPPSRRINATMATTASIRAKKRRKITTAVATTTATKIDYSNNNVAENGVQFEVHEDETRINFNEQVAHIVKTFLDDTDADADIDIDIDDANDDNDDHDSITDGRTNNNNNNNKNKNNEGDYDSSSDSSNNEAIIKRTKRVVKKSKQINSKPQPASAATATATAHSIGDNRNGNCADSGTKYVTIRTINTDERDVRWEEMYQRLVAYKTEHKDTNVPQSYKKDPKLGKWVNAQRYCVECAFTRE